jgi:large subunit ribosomal protein L18
MVKNRLARRRYSIRKRVVGTAERPRLTVRRSNKHIYAILVDDGKRKVLSTVSSTGKEFAASEGKKTDLAKEVGKVIASKAKAIGIGQVVFDRGGYRYHGRVKAVADGAREGGLKF